MKGKKQFFCSYLTMFASQTLRVPNNFSLNHLHDDFLSHRDSHVNPEKYLIENFDATLGGVEVTYNGGTTDEDLMWV